MEEQSQTSSRRTMLKLTGASLATVAGAGVASAGHEHPDVETEYAQTISADSVKLHGDLTDIGDSADYVGVWFAWGPYGENLDNWTTRELMYSPGEFTYTLTGLEQGDYQYRAVANEEDDRFHVTGDVRAFSVGHVK